MNTQEAKKARRRRRKDRQAREAVRDFPVTVLPLPCGRCGEFGLLSTPIRHIAPGFAAERGLSDEVLSMFCPVCEASVIGMYCTDPNCSEVH